MGWFGIGSAVVGMVDKALDKILPDAAEREKAKLLLRQLEQEGKLQELELQMSAIMAEAKSSDPWTSRARPTFLYCIYVLILMAIPMGFLGAWNPELAFNIADSFNNWLLAIPADLMALFGVGYLGYTGSRTYEKMKGVAKS